MISRSRERVLPQDSKNHNGEEINAEDDQEKNLAVTPYKTRR